MKSVINSSDEIFCTAIELFHLGSFSNCGSDDEVSYIIRGDIKSFILDDIRDFVSRSYK